MGLYSTQIYLLFNIIIFKKTVSCCSIFECNIYLNIINYNIWKVLKFMPWKDSLHVFSFLISAKFVVCITDSCNYKCIEAFWLNNECLKTNKKASNAFSAYFSVLISPSVSEDFFVVFLLLFILLVKFTRSIKSWLGSLGISWQNLIGKTFFLFQWGFLLLQGEWSWKVYTES